MLRLTELPAWKTLKEHQQAIDKLQMRALFAEDPQRFERFSLRFDDILFDYSKQRITTTTRSLLIKLAEQAGLAEKISQMFAGEPINCSEQRAALHIALRNRSERPILVGGNDVMPQVKAVLEKMREFCTRVRTGRWVGASGRPVTDIINIGIGGSDLGPLMVTEALKPYGQANLRVHFVSNVDATHLTQTLQGAGSGNLPVSDRLKNLHDSGDLIKNTTVKNWRKKSLKYIGRIFKFLGIIFESLPSNSTNSSCRRDLNETIPYRFNYNFRN